MKKGWRRWKDGRRWGSCFVWNNAKSNWDEWEQFRVPAPLLRLHHRLLLGVATPTTGVYQDPAASPSHKALRRRDARPKQNPWQAPWWSVNRSQWQRGSALWKATQLDALLSNTADFTGGGGQNAECVWREAGLRGRLSCLTASEWKRLRPSNTFLISPYPCVPPVQSLRKWKNYGSTFKLK